MNYDVFSPFIKRPPSLRINSYHASAVMARHHCAWQFFLGHNWAIRANSMTGQFMYWRAVDLSVVCLFFFSWKAHCVIIQYTKFHCTYFECITLIYNRNWLSFRNRLYQSRSQVESIVDIEPYGWPWNHMVGHSGLGWVHGWPWTIWLTLKTTVGHILWWPWKPHGWDGPLT